MPPLTHLPPVLSETSYFSQICCGANRGRGEEIWTPMFSAQAIELNTAITNPVKQILF